MTRHPISSDGTSEAEEERIGRERAAPSHPPCRRTWRTLSDAAREKQQEKEEDRAAGFEHAPCSIWLSHVARTASIHSLQSRLAPRAGSVYCSLIVVVVTVSFLFFPIALRCACSIDVRNGKTGRRKIHPRSISVFRCTIIQIVNPQELAMKSFR